MADPVAHADLEIACRLYTGPTYSLLLAARWNGSTPTGATTISLPADARQALSGVAFAVEIDAYSLSVTDVTPTLRTYHDADDAPSQVDVTGGVSAVLLPTPTCPGLLQLEPAVVPTIDATRANSTTLRLHVHAWQAAARKSGTNDAAIAVAVRAPGLSLSASSVTLVPGATLTLRVANSTASADKRPKFFMLTMEGEGVLPTRRWVKAV